MSVSAAVGLLWVLTASPAPAQHAPPMVESERPRLVVLELAAAGGLEPSIAAALTEAVAAELGARGYFEVTAQKEVQTLLGVERQRALMGCGEEGSCLTELAGALGARFVLSGSLARLGATYQLTLQTLDTKTTRPVGRAVRLAKSVDGLRAGLPFILAEATGTPAPPAPSHLLAYGLIGGGGLVLAAGGVVGIFSLNQEAALKKELDLGVSSPTVLKPVVYYRDQASSLRLQKTLALSGMALGAALAGLGVFLNPSDAGDGKLALSLTGSGVALVGSF